MYYLHQEKAAFLLCLFFVWWYMRNIRIHDQACRKFVQVTRHGGELGKFFTRQMPILLAKLWLPMHSYVIRYGGMLCYVEWEKLDKFLISSSPTLIPKFSFFLSLQFSLQWMVGNEFEREVKQDEEYQLGNVIIFGQNGLDCCPRKMCNGLILWKYGIEKKMQPNC